MRLLLDTHVFLWAMEDSPRLSKRVRAMLVDPTHDILVSSVSAWEIAIKKGKGLLQAPDDIEAAVQRVGFIPHTLNFAAARTLTSLPCIHRDPFDRMLIAQAMTAGIPLVSHDAQIAAYPLQVVW